MVAKARDWIWNNYYSIMTIKNKKEYITSLPNIPKEEEEYRKELNNYIIDQIKVININTPENKNPSIYLEALTGIKDK